LYGDGILREWTLKSGGKLATIVVASIPSDPTAQIGIHSSGQPWAVSQGRWTFFERGGAPWPRQGEFPINSSYKNLRPQSRRLTCLLPSDKNRVQLTTLAVDKFARTTLREVNPTRHFAELGDEAYLWSVPAIGFYVARRSDSPKTAPRILACSSEPSCLEAQPCGPKQYLVLIGFATGSTQVWRLDFSSPIWSPQLLLDVQSHHGPVTAIAFAGADRIISGGSDRTIILRKLKQSTQPDNTVEGRFLLTIRCRNLRINGVKGPAEYELLQTYIAQQTK
jgi:WD40 repeat protein